jgi:hypothetical protein
MLHFARLLFVLVMICVLFAPGVSTGEQTTDPGIDCNVTGVQRAKQLTNAWGSLVHSGRGSFLVVSCSVGSQDSDPRMVRREDFTLYDDAGRSYSLDPNSEQELFQARLLPGVSITSRLIFQVPDDAAGFVLELKPRAGFAGLAPLRIELDGVVPQTAGAQGSGYTPATLDDLKKEGQGETAGQSGGSPEAGAPGVAGGSAQTPATTASSQGTRLRSGPLVLTLFNSRTTANYNSGFYSWVQSELGVFVVLEVNLRNASQEPLSLRPAMFSLRDVNGRSHAAHTLSDRELTAAGLQPGESRSGTVVFELPSDAAQDLVFSITADTAAPDSTPLP